MPKQYLKKIVCVLLIFVIVITQNAKAYAYVLNGYVVPDPNNIRYVISASTSPLTAGIDNFVEIWESYCTEVNFEQYASGGIITINGDYNINNGTYAVCTHGANGSSNITLYQSYYFASSLEQHEVIAHEIGHSLGLAHCQPTVVDNSVMREYGFNGKPYPLYDDIMGISYLY